MFKLKSVSGLVAASLVSVPAMLSFPVDGWTQIEEIIVTTRRREESLQDVPISVGILSSTEIERFGIGGIEDVAKYTAGMEFDAGYGAQDTRVVLRGLSPTRGRPNVAFMVDGVDFTGEAILTSGGGFNVNQRLIDVERIEVVKGPQSALFGRSAFAGATQYVTKNPNMEEVEAEVSVDIGDEEQYTISGSVGGPVSENFGLRVNGLWWDKDGFYTNTITNENVGGGDGWGLAVKGLWEPTETLTVAGRLAYSEDNYAPAAQARVRPNTIVNIISPIPGGNLIEGSFFGGFGGYLDCAGAATTADNTLTSCTGTPKIFSTGKAPDADQLTIANAPDPLTGSEYNGTEVDLTTFTLSATWEAGFGTVTSITGVAHSESEQDLDGNWDSMPAGDHSSLDGEYTFTLADCGFPNCSPVGQEIDWATEIDLFSQELRYATDWEGPVNLSFGALYWTEEADQVGENATVSPSIVRSGAVWGPIADFPPAYTVLPNVAHPTLTLTGREIEHWSVYGLMEWEIDLAWKLSIEGRYVDEKLTVYGAKCDPVGTQATLGIAPDAALDPVTGELQCSGRTFRGPSSTGTTVAGGTLPVGILSTAVTTVGSAKSSDDYFTPKVTLEWTPNDTQMWYFSWAEGKKPGGMTTISAGTFFDPVGRSYTQETLTAWEIGTKSNLLDGALVLNSALFFQDYEDKQVGVTKFNQRTQTDYGSIENAGEAEIWGIELSAQWQPSERWLLTAQYTWLDAEYTDFTYETGSANEVARSQLVGNGGCLAIVPTATPNTDDIRDVCIVSSTGNKVEDIPEHAFVGAVQYTAPLAATGMDWFASFNGIFTDERWVDEQNVMVLDSYWMFDARIGLMTDNWDVLLYVDNLTDDDTSKSGLDVGSQVETARQGHWPPGPTSGIIINMPDPRIFGVRATYRF